MRAKSLCFCSVLTLTFAVTSLAEDWPKWRGPRGDGISLESGLLDRWAEGGPARLWSVEAGKGYSSPIAHNGIIYIFGQIGKRDVLTALTADKGDQVWRQGYEPVKWNDGGYPGPRATPTIDGDHIYTFGGGGDLVCWKLAGGKLLWRINVLRKTGSGGLQWGSASSPLIDGNVIYVACGTGGPAAIAVDKSARRILWKSQARRQAGYAPTVIAGVGERKLLLVFAGEGLIAMDARTGQTVWAQPFETSYKINAATPIVHEGRVFITNGYKPGRGALLALEPTGPREIWTNDLITGRFVTPILEKGFLYANSKGTIKCVRWQDGKLQWQCEDKRLNLGNGGSIVRVGDMLVALSEKGKLSLAEATPKGIHLRGQMQLFEESNTWSTPLIYGRKLYVKGNNALVCLDVASP